MGKTVLSYTQKRYKLIKNEFELSSKDIFKSGIFLNGKYTELLTKALMEYTKYPYVILTSNGTMSLFIIAKFYSKYYKKILTTPVSFKATYNAFRQAGYEIEYTTIDEYLMGDYSASNDLLNLSVGLLGKQPILNENNFNIEDACQHWINSPTTNTKAISFDPTKNIASCGNGGAILTYDKDLYNYTHKMIKHDSTVNGLNLRITELEAAYIYHQTPYINSLQDIRRNQALRLNNTFQTSLFDDSPNHDIQKYVIRKEELHLVKDIKTKVLYPEILNNEYYQLLVF